MDRSTREHARIDRGVVQRLRSFQKYSRAFYLSWRAVICNRCCGSVAGRRPREGRAPAACTIGLCDRHRQPHAQRAASDPRKSYNRLYPQMVRYFDDTFMCICIIGLAHPLGSLGTFAQWPRIDHRVGVLRDKASNTSSVILSLLPFGPGTSHSLAYIEHQR